MRVVLGLTSRQSLMPNPLITESSAQSLLNPTKNMELTIEKVSNWEVSRQSMKHNSAKSNFLVYKSFAEKDGKDVRSETAKKPDNIQIGLDKGTYVTEQKANYQPRDLALAQSNSQFIK